MGNEIFKYLETLPPSLKVIGDWKKNEIQLAITEEDLKEASKEGIDTNKVGIMFEDSYCKIIYDLVKFPNKKYGIYRRIVWGKDKGEISGVVVFPVTKDKKIIFRDQFRHATRSWEYGVVRGFKEIGDNGIETVIKEVKEELGYKTSRIEYLGVVHPDTGALTSKVEVYYVELEELQESRVADESEALGEYLIIDEEIFKGLIEKNIIKDSYTICAYTLVKLKGYI